VHYARGGVEGEFQRRPPRAPCIFNGSLGHLAGRQKFRTRGVRTQRGAGGDIRCVPAQPLISMP
jgi:hypothetical protein